MDSADFGLQVGVCLLRESVERYILTEINNPIDKQKSELAPAFLPLPPPRGYQLDAELVSPSSANDFTAHHGDESRISRA